MKQTNKTKNNRALFIGNSPLTKNHKPLITGQAPLETRKFTRSQTKKVKPWKFTPKAINQPRLNNRSRYTPKIEGEKHHLKEFNEV